MLGTPLKAPKVRALAANSKVALTIDGNTWPYKVLQIRGSAHVQIVAGVVQGRADWGMAITTVAKDTGLAFLPVREECFDFAILRSRWDRPAVTAFRELLADSETRKTLIHNGFCF